jgi:hypothetical protein
MLSILLELLKWNIRFGYIEESLPERGNFLRKR